MAKNLSISGETFAYPENKDSPGWGVEATQWAEAVTNVLNGITSPFDILLTSANIANNQSTPANIPGFKLPPTTIRTCTVEYSIYRRILPPLATNYDEYVESGQLIFMHKTYPLAGNGSWEIVRTNGGNSGPDFGVEFTITSTGQVQYTSDNIDIAPIGTGYSGLIKFRVKVYT